MNICFISPKQKDDIQNIKLFLMNIHNSTVNCVGYMAFITQQEYIKNCDVIVADVSSVSEFTFLLLGVYFAYHDKNPKIVLFTNNKRNLKLEWIPDEFNYFVAKNYFELGKIMEHLCQE